MHLTRRAALVWACAALVSYIALPAEAKFVPQVGYEPEGTGAVVTINGHVAVWFLASNAGFTTIERAKITAQRLGPLAEGGWKTIKVRSISSKRADVVTGSKLICMATAADAKANNTSTLALAQSWSSRLHWLFSQPPVTISPSNIVTAEGGTQTAIIDGALNGPYSAFDRNPSIATSTVDSAKHNITIYGNSAGRGTVEVNCQGYTATATVDVKRYAARLSGLEIAEVTGNPAPGWLIEQAVAQAAPRTISLEPGATATFGKPILNATSLRAGGRISARMPVKVSGKGLLPIELIAPVEVYNRLIDYVPTSKLFYSNNPERITRFGTLFTGKLALDERQRLLYHHQNMLGKRVHFVIELINAGNLPASIQTVSGIAPPLVDTVAVGYSAGMDFIKDYLSDAGQIYRIPPKSRFVIYARDLRHLRTASGIIDMRQLSGDKVYLRVAADLPDMRPLDIGESATILNADVPTKLSEHVFTAPLKKLDAKYVVGSRWTFIRMGKYAIRDDAEERELFGNYGVIYEINVRVENPTADRCKIRVIFEPTAGPASGIFVIGGKIIGVRTVTPPKEFEVTSVSLGPGETRDLSIMTIPLAGSAYPATIVVKN